MTIQEFTICNIIQSFPVLLILAQKQNRCLETHFVYKPPSPTQSPEYYQALDALFQNLYGQGYPGHSHGSHQPCYIYSKKYGAKPCHGYADHGYYGSHGSGYGSLGTGHGSLGTGYGSLGTGYGSLGTSYASVGTSYGSLGSYGLHSGYGKPGGTYYVPSYRKGNIYSGNVTYGGYASSQGYTANSKYKVVVKKTKIGTKIKKKGKLIPSGRASALLAKTVL